MDIYKRPGSTKWQYWFRVKGKLYRGSTKVPLQYPEQARQVMAREYEKVMNQKVLGAKPEATLEVCFDRIIERVQGNPKTAESYIMVKRKFLGLDRYADAAWWSLPASTKLSELEDTHIEDMFSDRVGAGYKVNSVNVEIRVIKAMYNANKKRFACNPDLTFPVLKYEPKKRFLTKREELAVIERLKEFAGSPAYDKALDLFIFLIDTGVRLSEALDIAWADINDALNSMEVYRTKTRNLSVVPISDRVRILLERKSNQPAPFMEMSRAVRLLRQIINEVCNTNERINAQRGRATVHSLRDTYASRLVQNGMSLLAVSKLLGHASPTMTMKYAHLEPQQTAEEARRIINS